MNSDQHTDINHENAWETRMAIGTEHDFEELPIISDSFKECTTELVFAIPDSSRHDVHVQITVCMIFRPTDLLRVQSKVSFLCNNIVNRRPTSCLVVVPLARGVCEFVKQALCPSCWRRRTVLFELSKFRLK